MTIRHIRIFLSVCDCENNITKAAEKLYMAQPAVSLAISDLEKYYGVKLFDRISRRLYLTEAGKQFRQYALRISALFNDMEKGLRNWDAFGVLRIGSSMTIGSQFMPSYVEAFSAQHPNVDVHVQIGPSDQLEQQLMSNQLDLALVEGPVRTEVLLSEEYMEDSLTVICPAHTPFYSGQILTQDEFLRQRFLLREKGSGTRDVFDDVMQESGLSVTPVWEGMSTTALVNAVIHGLGITVVPRRMVSAPLEKGLVYALSVQDLAFKRQFRIVYHKDKYLPSSALDFIALCKNFEFDYPLPKYSGLS